MRVKIDKEDMILIPDNQIDIVDLGTLANRLDDFESAAGYKLEEPTTGAFLKFSLKEAVKLLLNRDTFEL